MDKITHIKNLGNKSHIFRVNGELEVYQCNKHFAGYTIPYKNTRMEFCRGVLPDDVLI